MTGWTWGNDHYAAVNSSKPNILSGNSNFFESRGKYYYYGNKGEFGMVDTTSVGQYMMKNTSIAAQLNAATIKEMAIAEIDVDIDDLSCVIPLVISLIAPVLNTAFE